MRWTWTMGVTLALAAGLAGQASAQQGNRAFCSLDGDGRTLCYYDRFEQCIEAMRGVQGTCFANPAGPPAASQQKQKKKK